MKFNLLNKSSNMRNHKQNRKAQITIFIILAIIILFAVALFFYIRLSTIQVKPPVQQLEVNDEIKPIQLYETDCLNRISKQALIEIGKSGGYSEITGMKVSSVPYDSDVLIFSPQKIPYWYYLKDCSQSQIGCLNTQKPFLCQADSKDCVIKSYGDNSIQEQLNKYIEKQLPICLDNFDSFADRFTITPGNMSVDSKVTETGVYFTLNYPLDITIKSTNKNTKELQYVVAEQQVKLKEIYQLASEISDSEQKYNFLEVATMNLIAVFSGLDENRQLPPTDELTFNSMNGQNKIWTNSVVKTKMKEEVLPYLNFVQIIGTGNAQSIFTRDTSDYAIYAQGIYKSLEFKFTNNTYFDLNANIIYPYSDFYLKIGDSEIIKPEKLVSDNNVVMKMIGFFFVQYKFKYDISYPVIVKISDPEAFNGEGYDFNYAMEANIRQNLPVNGNITVINFGGVNGIDLNSELQNVNRTITIETYDKHTHEALDGVIITYKCGKEFSIGQTEIEDGKAVLSQKFPYCEMGGQILYEKPGYMGSAMDYDNPEGKDAKTFKLELWPLQEKNILIFKRTPSNIETIRKKGAGAISLYSIAVSQITNNESVFLTVGREKTRAEETDVPLIGFTNFKSDNSSVHMPTYAEKKASIEKLYSDGKIDAATKDQMLFDLNFLKDNPTSEINSDSIQYQMEFVPGTYDVDAFMMFQGPVHIPAETRKICVGVKVLGVCIGKTKTIDLPEQNFETWINGGAKLNFTLSENDVYSDRDTLIFYVLEQPRPTSWGMLENYKDIETYQQGKTFLLKPRLE